MVGMRTSTKLLIDYKMPNTNKYIKSFILFESDNINSDEIPWEVFWEFIQDSQDVFMEIMDDDLLLSDYGKYSFDYQDDFIFLKFKKPTDLETISFLWEDIKIAGVDHSGKNGVV